MTEQSEVSTVYDRFTELGRRAIVASRDAADALGHNAIGTEHLLLGLAQTAGVASEALRAQGVGLTRLHAEVTRLPAVGTGRNPKEGLATLGNDIDEIRRRADASFGPGALKYPRPPFSLEAKQAIKASLEQATAIGQQHVDTEHLLLGILENGGTAVSVLTAVGTDLDLLRRSLRERASG